MKVLLGPREGNGHGRRSNPEEAEPPPDDPRLATRLVRAIRQMIGDGLAQLARRPDSRLARVVCELADLVSRLRQEPGGEHRVYYLTARAAVEVPLGAPGTRATTPGAEQPNARRADGQNPGAETTKAGRGKRGPGRVEAGRTRRSTSAPPNRHAGPGRAATWEPPRRVLGVALANHTDENLEPFLAAARRELHARRTGGPDVDRMYM